MPNRVTIIYVTAQINDKIFTEATIFLYLTSLICKIKIHKYPNEQNIHQEEEKYSEQEHKLKSG